ncbi:cilia and flagella associated protein 410 [Stigmatopora argus]
MRLTRTQVLTEAKAPDLESVRKLNCWGSKLSDVSILAEMPNIEVLTLSVNGISSLAPLAGCLSLCELYLRRNMIASLSELWYLRPMRRLRVLWLADNPCCGKNSSQYRLTVLRCLPRLQKLDNQVVTEDEILSAQMEGEEISAPANGAEQQLSTNGHDNAKKDSLGHNMGKTNLIFAYRTQELKMKPRSRDKFPTLHSQSTRSSMKKTHTLDAVLLLLKDLDHEDLRVVHMETQNRLRIYTLDSLKTLQDSQQSQSVELQQ